MSSPTDMAASESSMPASQAGENFINIQDLRELIYNQITPMNSHEYAGLFLSCKAINEEATESLFKSRRKLIAAEEKRCSELYRAPVRIQQPTSISDLRNARVELPQSMFVTKLMKYLKFFRNRAPQDYPDDYYNEDGEEEEYEEEEEEEEEYEDDYDGYDSDWAYTGWPPKPKQRKQPMFSEPLDTLFLTLYADTTPDLVNNSKYQDDLDHVRISHYVDGITTTVIDMGKNYLWQRLANWPMPSNCLLKAKTVVFDWGDKLDSEHPQLPPFLHTDIDQSHWHTEDWAMSMKQTTRTESRPFPTRGVYKWERKVEWEFDHRTEQQQHEELADFKVAYKAANGGQDPKEIREVLYKARGGWPSDADMEDIRRFTELMEL